MSADETRQEDSETAPFERSVVRKSRPESPSAAAEGRLAHTAVISVVLAGHFAVGLFFGGLYIVGGALLSILAR